MPAPPPPVHTRFKKGQSGNPGGKPKQLLTKDTVYKHLSKFAHMSRVELQEKVINNPSATMLEIMIASVMVRAAKDGDYARLSFLLDRSVGKVKDESAVQLLNKIDPELQQVPVENLIKIAKDLKTA